MCNNIIARLLGRHKNRNSHSTTSPQFQNSLQSSNETDFKPKYQDWHEFNPSTQKLNPIDATSSYHSSPTCQANGHDTNLILATWNIDAGGALPKLRTSAILSHLSGLTPSPDIIFLQEVSRPSLEFLLRDEKIREIWLSSEMDSKNWGGHFFLQR